MSIENLERYDLFAYGLGFDKEHKMSSSRKGQWVRFEDVKKIIPDKQITCKCIVKNTEINDMCIIYPKRDCPIHGHLHHTKMNNEEINYESYHIRYSKNKIEVNNIIGFVEVAIKVNNYSVNISGDVITKRDNRIEIQFRPNFSEYSRNYISEKIRNKITKAVLYMHNENIKQLKMNNTHSFQKEFNDD